MKYYIGIDGGGTKTNCVIADAEGNILSKCTGGHSNFLIYGTDEVSQVIFELIQKCLSQLNLNFTDIGFILIGVTGGGRRTDAERLEKSLISFFKTKGIEFEKVLVESDARIALEGAFSGNPGSILIAGTGSIMFGKDPEGNIHRAGGFGRFLGDEGSGYSIGQKGLAAVAKEFDGRGEHSDITRLAGEKFNITSSEILITKVYKDNFNIASAAPLVLDAAVNNDKIALRIIDKESDGLILLIETMIKKLNQPVLNLAFIGGLLNSDNIFSRTLREKIAAKLPKVNLIEAENPPEIGALLMIKRLLKE